MASHSQPLLGEQLEAYLLPSEWSEPSGLVDLFFSEFKSCIFGPTVVKRTAQFVSENGIDSPGEVKVAST